MTHSTQWSETPLPGEDALFEEVAAAINELQRQSMAKQGGPVRRAFHAKQLTGARAQLRVMEGLPSHARHGLFSESRSYDAWVRFSLGSPIVRSDKSADMHGLALKVQGAPGPTHLEPGAGSGEQDFVTANDPVFLLRDALQYVAFARLLTGRLGLLGALRRVGLPTALHAARVLLRHRHPRPSLALDTYWTGAAVSLGQHAVKLLLRPADAPAVSGGPFESDDYLREEMTARLASGDVRFELMAQFFVDPARTPVEDPTVEWTENDAPPVKLAELTIARREPSAAQTREDEARVDGMVFTPWHGSTALRPLGSLMRMRRRSYEASAKLRG